MSDLPIWLQTILAVAGAIGPAAIYLGAKLEKINHVLGENLPDRVLVLETKAGIYWEKKTGNK
jgi:hypothetical protein